MGQFFIAVRAPKHGALPKFLSFTVANRRALRRRYGTALVGVASARLSPTLRIRGRKVYEGVAVVLRRIGSSARVTADGPPDVTDLLMKFFLGSGGNEGAAIAFERELDEQIHLPAPPPPPACSGSPPVAGANGPAPSLFDTTSYDDTVPVTGDSAGPVDRVMTTNHPATDAALTPSQLLSDAVSAACKPPAPAAFYAYLGVPTPGGGGGGTRPGCTFSVDTFDYVGAVDDVNATCRQLRFDTMVIQTSIPARNNGSFEANSSDGRSRAVSCSPTAPDDPSATVACTFSPTFQAAATNHAQIELETPAAESGLTGCQIAIGVQLLSGGRVVASQNNVPINCQPKPS